MKPNPPTPKKVRRKKGEMEKKEKERMVQMNEKSNCYWNYVLMLLRYRSMGLATVQSKDQMVRMKVMKEMNRSGVEAMRSKIGMKSNVIRNLPNNVTF